MNQHVRALHWIFSWKWRWFCLSLLRNSFNIWCFNAREEIEGKILFSLGHIQICRSNNYKNVYLKCWNRHTYPIQSIYVLLSITLLLINILAECFTRAQVDISEFEMAEWRQRHTCAFIAQQKNEIIVLIFNNKNVWMRFRWIAFAFIIIYTYIYIGYK